MKFLQKIQNLPERTRKIILWSLVAVLAAGLLVWWAQTSQQRLAEFPGGQFLEGLDFPEIKMPDMPEFPDLSQIEIEINETTTDQIQTNSTE